MDTGILLDAAMNLRWERAERFGWIQLASSSAPTWVSGLVRCAYCWPATVVLPLVGLSNPRINRMVVDLPEPLGPRKPVTAPGRTVNDRSSTATVFP